MRGGANTTCSVHQTLTSEAASVLKQSLGLARRRGHAQVTPLHVAFTLLSSRASDLLRRACLKSQPPLQLASHHPLQCRALELCFNVALNRLPTITTSPVTSGTLLHHAHHQQPSLSNALVAALKRAQAHQRKGSIEQQQQNQPLLAAKVELEQLVLSILDDPSVSRVMREAGFSSPSVKSHIEDSLSSSSVFQYHSTSISGVYSSPPSPSKDNVNCFWPNQYFYNHPTAGYFDQSSPLVLPLKSKNNSVSSLKLEDIKLVVDVMMSKSRSNTVIVGDSGTFGETLVWELRDRVKRGDHRLPSELRTARFIRLRFEAEALRLMKREDVEEKYLKELRREVEESSTTNNKSGNNNGGAGAGGCIIYVGDLKWAIYPHESGDGADYLVKEIARLVMYNGSSRSARVWLVATASLQTYMKCQMRHPPLDVQWGLQTVSVPSGGLGLSLHASSLNEQIIPLLQSPSNKEEKGQLNCCGECSSNYEKEVGVCKPSNNKLLPSWLQPQCTEVDSRHQDELVELRRKWNTLCQSLHQGITCQTATPLISSIQSPIINPKQWWLPQNKSLLFPDTSSISLAVPGQDGRVSNSVPWFRRQNPCTMESKSLPNLSSLRNTEDKELKITLALGNNDYVTVEPEKNNMEMASWQRGNMCRVLKEYIPWQFENIPGIVEVMLGSCNEKSDTWFLIQGNDQIGKMRMASGIAESMFGGASSSVLHLKMGATLDVGEVLSRTLQHRNDPIVILVEDFDLGDTRFLKLLTDRFENGSAKLDRVIFVLTMSGNDVVKPTMTTIPMVLKVYKKGSPLNKRKTAKEEDDYYLLMSRIPKNPRIATINRGMESNNTNKHFSRQSSFNSLDLNIRADDLDDASPVSSDLTLEMNTSGMSDAQMISPCDHLVRSIKNKFFFNRSPSRDREMKEVIGSKIKASFDEVYGGGGGAHTNNEVNLGIEDSVLEMVLLGGGDSFVNNVFERWVKEIFKTSLERGKVIINMGENGISFKLCVHVGGDTIGEGGGGGGGGGFLGTNLPNNIVVSFA